MLANIVTKMGCASSRESGNEEHLIVQAERSLRFSSLNIKDVDAAFRKNNCNGEVLESHLIKMNKDLGFRIPSAPERSSIQKFYSIIKSESGFYPLQDILLIAILLGRGKPILKAKLIYEIFDSRCTHQLEINYVNTDIVMRILTHCCSTLLDMVEPEHLQAEHHLNLSYYKEKLNSSMKLAAEEISKRLVIRGKVISLDTFVEVFSENCLTTPSEIRRFVINLRKKNPALSKSQTLTL